MEDEIYVANKVGSRIKSLPREQQERVLDAIETLKHDGWRNSQVVVPDAESPGGGLRAAIKGNIRLFFRYAPEEHAIIVADVSSIYEQELSAVA